MRKSGKSTFTYPFYRVAIVIRSNNNVGIGASADRIKLCEIPNDVILKPARAVVFDLERCGGFFRGGFFRGSFRSRRFRSRRFFNRDLRYRRFGCGDCGFLGRGFGCGLLGGIVARGRADYVGQMAYEVGHGGDDCAEQ